MNKQDGVRAAAEHAGEESKFPPARVKPSLRDELQSEILEQLDRIRAEVAASTERTATAGDLHEVLAQLDELHAYGRASKRAARRG